MSGFPSLGQSAPVTAQNDVPPSEGRKGVDVDRSVAPSLIVFTTGLVAVSANQPKAALLFIGAGTVTLALYFVVPPTNVENTHTNLSVFLRRMPDVFTATSCILVVLGIGLTFPSEMALVPLFAYVSFATLAALSDRLGGVWTTAGMYGASLLALTTFVILVFVV